MRIFRKPLNRITKSRIGGQCPNLLPVLFLWMALSAPAVLQAQVKRVVIIKVDGLPYDVVDRYVRQVDPLTGKSRLPWFEHIFYVNGTRVTNFYVRGMSLSAPSWSLVDTGQHLQIKGNVEFDRDVLHTYDYLNFLPFVIKQGTRGNVDMPGTEVLDSVQLPLLMDAYDNYQRLPGSQLYGRGVRIAMLQRAAQAKFVKNPKVLADEFIVGLETRNIISDQLERELIERLKDPRVEYLDLLDTSFDHAAHHNNDSESHLEVLRQLDGLLGRIWTTIQNSPLASETALMVVSDHGFNTDEHVISQGFNLVKLLGSYQGGGHHVITKRRLLMDYSIKAVNPFVPLITTTTPQSYYLKGQSTDYPTALLDFDGNERAALHLRNSHLNVIHILLQQLQRKDLSSELRAATTRALLAEIKGQQPRWQVELDQFDEELPVLARAAEKQRALCEAQPKKFSAEEKEMGRDDNARRICIKALQWSELEKSYRTYVTTMRNLLSLKPESLTSPKFKIEELVPKEAMGARNSVYDLQNYVVALAKDGLVFKSDGSLDREKSFLQLNYLDLIHEQTVRNNVQAGVSTHPVDFIATRLPRELIAPALSQDLQPDDDPIWLYAGSSQQALILPRGEARGQLQLNYLPIANLTQDPDGKIHFEQIQWKPGLPLKIFEDPRLDVPVPERAAWLSAWHTDLEWLHATHKTQYSNGLIGLHEQMTLFTAPGSDTATPGLTADETLLHRFHRRQRRLVETDMLIVANNHWNFDVRGFNPGGNHGSFFRISTHSTLMFAGGDRTGIPRGRVVSEPYDSLSIVPTVLALTGDLKPDNEPVDALVKRGFKKFPGRVITEVAGTDFGLRSTPTAQ
jgi:hypothetical protein